MSVSRERRRVCVISDSPPSTLETFVKAHVDRLPFETTYLYAAAGRFWHDGIDISDRYNADRDARSQMLNLLPRFIEFRIRNKVAPRLSPSLGLAKFLREHEFAAVLAEYGPVAAAVTEACKSVSVPLIAHFHGYDASRHDILDRYQKEYRAMFAYASSVLVVSAAMRERIVRAGCPSHKVVRTACGPDETFYSVEPDYSSNTVLMVGRLVEKKAPHLSILAFSHALSQYDALRLSVVGGGPLAGTCRDLAGALGITDSVDFRGILDPGGIKREMSNALLFLQHSVTADDGDMEGTPVAILEAEASALPVVATLHGGIPDAVLDGKTGYLVNERDVNGMADAIVRLARDRNLAQSMGQAGRDHIISSFSMKKHIDEVTLVIERATVT